MNANMKSKLLDGLQGTAGILFVGWLCYRNIIVALIGLAALPFFMKYKTQKRIKERQAAQGREFKDAVAMMYSSIAAGGTLEKAIRDARNDMSVSEERYPVLLPEFEKMCIQLERNISVEMVLNEFAEKSQDEDIRYFVKIVNVAKKSGGSLADIIKHTVDTMNLRLEIDSEIETMLAGKKGEWKVMMIVPPAILVYMNLCSSEYMSVLYETLLGRMLMTAALVMYAVAVVIGYKILDIHV